MRLSQYVSLQALAALMNTKPQGSPSGARDFNDKPLQNAIFIYLTTFH